MIEITIKVPNKVVYIGIFLFALILGLTFSGGAGTSAMLLKGIAESAAEAAVERILEVELVDEPSQVP